MARSDRLQIQHPAIGCFPHHRYKWKLFDVGGIEIQEHIAGHFIVGILKFESDCFLRPAIIERACGYADARIALIHNQGGKTRGRAEEVEPGRSRHARPQVEPRHAVLVIAPAKFLIGQSKHCIERTCQQNKNDHQTKDGRWIPAQLLKE